MARKNRNNRSVLVRDTYQEQKVLYQTAIYARLSIEDNRMDSESIENQVYLLRRYLMNQSDLELVSVRSDNGYTGTSFERPEFQRMMEDVKNGKVNCIIVKDLSRFGRNYLETGNYLEQIFPYLGIRFISVNDNYDSKNAGANEALIVALKNIYHHAYAKDISRKICTLLDVKKKKGLFLGRFAPYGYKKSEIDRYLLEIDDDAASIIKDMFQWRLSGLGVVSIARKLNDLEIKSQYRRLYDQGLLKGTNHEAKALWSASSVLSILENPNYYGCIVERKSDAAYYKGARKRILPKEEWNYIENVHEGIIDKETFEKVQELIRESKKQKKQNKRGERKRKDNILQGLVVCGTCKKAMLRDSGYYDNSGNLIRHRYGCSAKYKKKDNCNAKTIPEDKLIMMIFHSLKIWISQFVECDKIIQSYLNSDEFYCKQEENQSKKEKMERDINNTKHSLMELYADYKNGILSKPGYLFARSQYEEKQSILEKQLDLLKKTVEEGMDNPDMKWINKILAFQDSTVLTREMCTALIKKVIVYDTYVELIYTYKDELNLIYKSGQGEIKYEV